MRCTQNLKNHCIRVRSNVCMFMYFNTLNWCKNGIDREEEEDEE